MSTDELVHSEPAFMTCPAVRVTPYGQDAQPDHAQGFTYWFDKPVTLAYIHRTALPEISTGTTFRVRDVPAIAAFIAPADHPQRTDLGYIDRYVRLQVGAYAAVELWTRHEDGWVYTLFPHWRHATADVWPHEPDPDAPVYCLGETTPSPSAWTWPAPGLSGYDVHAGTSAVIAVASAPPPPAGLPAVSGCPELSGGHLSPSERTPAADRVPPARTLSGYAGTTR